MGNITAATQAKARIRAQSEARILRAAERNFAQYGLAGATLGRIAQDAGMSTAALHYHYRDKLTLYRAVLEHILRLWLEETAVIEPDNDPRRAIGDYIRAKMRFARVFPDASKVFATEIIAGAGHIRPFLEGELRPLVERKRAVIAAWARQGRIRQVHPDYLLFLIWGATEFHANFAAEIEAVRGGAAATPDSIDEAAEAIVAIVLGGILPGS